MVKIVARFVRKKHATILGCPLGLGAAADCPVPLPGLEVGALATNEGKGGSITSLSVSTGLGASAGGK